MQRPKTFVIATLLALATSQTALAAPICDGSGGASGVAGALGVHQVRFRTTAGSGGSDMPPLGNGDFIKLATWSQLGSPAGGTLGACVVRADGTRNWYYAYDVTSPSTHLTQLTADSYISFGSATTTIGVISPTGTSRGPGWEANQQCFPGHPLNYPILQPFRYNGWDLWLYGDAGEDVIDGGSGGRDVVCGGSGRDELNGWAGDDELDGYTFSDILWGWDGDDTVWGGDGGDIILDWQGPSGLYDVYSGSNGNDCVEDDMGHRSMVCGAGSDSYVTAAGYTASSDCETRRPNFYDFSLLQPWCTLWGRMD